MNEDLKKSIGKTLRNIRKSKLLSVPDVFKGSGISVDTIYRYEQGRGNDINTLGELLDYYGIGFDIFFNQVYDNSHK